MSYLCHISNKKKVCSWKVQMKLKSAQLTDPKPNQRECHGSVSRMGPATSSFGRRDVSVNSNRAEFGNLRVSNWTQTGLSMTQPYWKEYYTRWKGLRPCWRWKGLERAIFFFRASQEATPTPMILLTSLGGNLWQFTAVPFCRSRFSSSISAFDFSHPGMTSQCWECHRMPKHRAPDPFLIYVLTGFVGAYKVLS